MNLRNWGLGIGDWGLGPIPNPQSPIPYKYYTKTITKLQNINYRLYYK